MALQSLSGFPLRLKAWPYDREMQSYPGYIYVASTITLDFAAERFAYLGEVFILDGSASKTFSSAGGKIHFKCGALTWSAGSSLTVGVQDTTQTSAHIQPDNTFDVSATIAGGGGLTANAINTATMGAGTKTITNGMKLSVVFDLTARAGTDSLVINSAFIGSVDPIFPGSVGDLATGTWSATTHSPGIADCLIEFDDGTYGIFSGGCWVPAVETSTTGITSASNPDEYGLRFTVPFKCTLWGVEFPVWGTATQGSGTMGTINLLSGAAATPSLVTSENCDGYDFTVANQCRRLVKKFATPQTLSPGTTYYVTFRATSTMGFGVTSITYPAASQLAWLPFGTGGYRVTRDGGTGAFTELTTTMMPVTLLISQLDDGAGGGGGGGLRLAGHGGLAA